MTADHSIFVKVPRHEHGLHMGSTERSWVCWQAWQAKFGGVDVLSPCFQHMRSIQTRIPIFSFLCLIQESLARS